jgi:hypothetical protein
MSESRDVAIAAMRDWLHARRPALPRDSFDEHTDIIGAGVLESLDLVEFMMLIEDLSGRIVLSEHLDPATLRTLATIYSHYFCGASE